MKEIPPEIKGFIVYFLANLLQRKAGEKPVYTINDITKEIVSNPNNARLYSFRAGLYILDGKDDQALSDYNKAIELNPDDPELYLLRSGLYVLSPKKADVDKALADLDKAVSLKPDNPDLYSFRASIYGIFDKSNDALQDYNKIIELNPKSLEGYIRRALFYFARAKFPEAEADINKTIELAPGDSDLYINRAQFYEMLGREEEALADYDKAIGLSPDASKLYLERAEFHRKYGNDEQALADYRKTIELNPKFGWAYAKLAEFYQGTNHLDDALETYQKMISADPQNPWVYLKRAEFHYRQKAFDQSLKDLQSAIDLEPQKSRGYFLKGLTLLAQRGYTDAAESFQSALKCPFDAFDQIVREPHMIKFYQTWAMGLASYYEKDNLDEAAKYFLVTKEHFKDLPLGEKTKPDTRYVEHLIDIYLQIIPLDAKLKKILSKPAELPDKTPILEGLKEQFSGMVKLTDQNHKEALSLLATKRDICRLLLPPDNPAGVSSQETDDLINKIKETLVTLKYTKADELIRILRENRIRLEAEKPFTPELAKVGEMADGMMTFDSTQHLVSEKLGKLIRVPEEVEVEETLDPKTGQYIQTKRRLKFRFVAETEFAPPGFGKITRKAPPIVKPNLVDIKTLIMKLRKESGEIIPPVAKEVMMSFIHNNLAVKIEVFIKDKWLQIGEFSPSQLPGFEHTQGDEPLMAWNLLVAFALSAPNGQPAPEGETKDETRKKKNAFYKQVDRLNEKLQALLGITDKAIVRDTTTGNYKSVIRLFASKHSTIE
ncbi:MAG: tetratricopeptide repeat protein [Candidatus Brocadiia bacterium]